MFRRATTAVVIALAVCAGGCALRSKPKPQPDLAQIFRPARELTGKAPIIVMFATPVHLALDQLQPMHLTLDLTVTPRMLQRRTYGLEISR